MDKKGPKEGSETKGRKGRDRGTWTRITKCCVSDFLPMLVTAFTWLTTVFFCNYISLAYMYCRNQRGSTDRSSILLSVCVHVLTLPDSSGCRLVSSFCLAFHSELEYRHTDERINSGDDATIHLVKFDKFWFFNPGDNVAYLCTLVWLLDKNWS